MSTHTCIFVSEPDLFCATPIQIADLKQFLDPEGSLSATTVVVLLVLVVTLFEKRLRLC